MQSDEELQQLNPKLREKLSDAGFDSSRAKRISELADFVEELCQTLFDTSEHNWFLSGSYGDVWGSNLYTMDGSVEESESDIDWTCHMLATVYHMRENCTCENPDQENVFSVGVIKEGHFPVTYELLREAAEKHKGVGLRPSIDECTAYACCAFPLELLRHSQSPVYEQAGISSEFIRDNVQLIQASRPGHESQEMRFSFSRVERRIMRSLSTVQGHLFILIKYFLNVVINSQLLSFKSYHAKMLLLFMLHRLPQDKWRPEQLVQLLQQSLRQLIKYISDTDMPQRAAMPSFFMRECFVYFHKKTPDPNPVPRLCDLLRQASDNLHQHLDEFMQQLRPVQHQQLLCHPYAMLPMHLTACFLSPATGRTHLYNTVRSCVLEVAVLPESRRASFLVHLDEFPPHAFAASLCLKVMTHLRFNDGASAAELLRIHQYHEVQHRLAGADTLRKGGDTAWYFFFCYDTRVRIDFSFLSQNAVYTRFLKVDRQYPVEVLVDFDGLLRTFRHLLLQRQTLDKWPDIMRRKRASLEEYCAYCELLYQSFEETRRWRLMFDLLNKFAEQNTPHSDFLPQLVRSLPQELRRLFADWLRHRLRYGLSVSEVALYAAFKLREADTRLLLDACAAFESPRRPLRYGRQLQLLRMRRRLCKLDAEFRDNWRRRLLSPESERPAAWVHELLAFLISAPGDQQLQQAVRKLETWPMFHHLKFKDLRMLATAKKKCGLADRQYLASWLAELRASATADQERPAFLLPQLAAFVDCLAPADVDLLRDCRQLLLRFAGNPNLTKTDSTKLMFQQFRLDQLLESTTTRTRGHKRKAPPDDGQSAASR